MKARIGWRVDTQRRAADITCYTDGQPAAEFSALTWTTSFARLADQADRAIFVADVADGI